MIIGLMRTLITSVTQCHVCTYSSCEYEEEKTKMLSFKWKKKNQKVIKKYIRKIS